MRAAECQQIREGAIRSFAVALDSELAQIRNEGVGLRGPRSSPPFGDQILNFQSAEGQAGAQPLDSRDGCGTLFRGCFLLYGHQLGDGGAVPDDHDLLARLDPVQQLRPVLFAW